MNTITIKYNGTVLTPSGFRGVIMTAIAEKISEKRCVVKEILEIDGEVVKASMSRTGANRQKFYGFGAAAREEGKTKNLSACSIVARE